jgi:hypothetical protein
MPEVIDNHVHTDIPSLKMGLPESPIGYRAQYAQRFLRHILAGRFTSVRDVARDDHGMAMALRDRFFEGPRLLRRPVSNTNQRAYRFAFDERAYRLLPCGAGNVLAIHADGVDECINATREEIRKGAGQI